MALITNNGLYSGRLGNLIYYIIDGKQYVRTFVVPNNPRTPRQQQHRCKIKTCGEYLRNFKKVIHIGYQGTPGRYQEYNEATQYHLMYAMEETTPENSEEFSFRVVPEKVRLSRGDIKQPEIYSCVRTGHTINLTWNPVLGTYSNRLTDAMAVVAYIPGKKVATNFLTGTRSDGSGIMLLPPDYTEPAMLWAFFWNGQRSAEPDRRNVSDSVYLGEV